MQEIFERLVAANIRILPGASGPKFILFERDGCVALVERAEDRFGGIGAAGVLTDKGFAPLVWRGGTAHFVAKGFDRLASDEDVARVRDFQRDLTAALGATPGR
jgi:hypothetical protein